MKKIKLIICMMAFASLSIGMQAQKVYESFNTINTGPDGGDAANGFSDGWSNFSDPNADITLESGEMEYNGQSTGSCLLLNNGEAIVRKLSETFPDVAGASYWFSVLLQCNTDSLPDHLGSVFLVGNLAEFKNNGRYCWVGFQGAPGRDNPLAFGFQGGGNLPAEAYKVRQSVWFVLRFDMTGDANTERVHGWYNPDETLTEEEMDTTKAYNGDAGWSGNIDYIFVNISPKDIEMQYDEIRIGTTWEDVKLNSVGIKQNSSIQLSLNASPNPFSSTTTISYNLATGQDVKVVVYDVMGKEVAVLANGFQDAGKQQLTLSSEGLAAGMYICKLQAGETVSTASLIIQK